MQAGLEPERLRAVLQSLSETLCNPNSGPLKSSGLTCAAIVAYLLRVEDLSDQSRGARFDSSTLSCSHHCRLRAPQGATARSPNAHSWCLPSTKWKSYITAAWVYHDNGQLTVTFCSLLSLHFVRVRDDGDLCNVGAGHPSHHLDVTSTRSRSSTRV